MSNTGPAELAELVHDDKKFRTYMVLVTQEIKAEQKEHRLDDDQRFADRDLRMDKMESKVGSVTSSVGSLEKVKSKLEGGWAAIAIIAAILLFVLDIGFKVLDHIK